MLWYMLVVLLYAITCCMALHNETEISAHGLDVQQIIYIYGPRQWKIQESNLIEKAGGDYSITSGIYAHKLHVEKMSWNEARKVCVQEGGHLAVINSISEEGILIQIMEENQIDIVWIGIHDLYKAGEWNTVMDQSLAATGYSKWRHGGPDNHEQKEHCGLFEKFYGKMDDRDCNDQFGFICEKAL